MAHLHKTQEYRECARCGVDNVGDAMFGIEPAVLSEPIETLCFCPQHDLQRELWTWGYQHGFPAISTGGYAIGAGRDMWFVTIGLGNDERIAELICYVMALDEDKIA